MHNPITPFSILIDRLELLNSMVIQLITQLSGDKISTTTTTISSRISTLQTNNNRSARHGAYKLFTINDVIEAFKKDLIEKEINIGESNVAIIVITYIVNLISIALNLMIYLQILMVMMVVVEIGGENSNINERENQYEASLLIGPTENDIYVRTIDINDYLQTFHMSIQFLMTFANIVSDEDRKKLISIQAHLEDLNNPSITQNKYGEHY
uniref:Uncharacterized protein n=1 Tax=Glossina austeni TaxID=7395 RepID=A0A1A9UD92_GLOAU